MWRDIRGALRNLARRPGLAVAVLLTLALGIGANSAVFTVVNAVLLRDLPFNNPDRLVAINTHRQLDGVIDEWRHSYLNFHELQESNSVFEQVETYSETQSLNMQVAGETHHVWSEFVSAGYFELLGIQPYVGRFFEPGDDSLPSGNRVAVISHSMWKRFYEGKRSLAERAIRLVDDVYVVVGVAPPGFRGLGDKADVWVPVTSASRLIGPGYAQDREVFWLSAAARLAEGVTLQQAQASMDNYSHRLSTDFPKINQGVQFRLLPARDAWFGELRTALWTLMAGAGFVLLIACTNVSNLLLARTLERRRELAIRSALGGSRWRLIRQILTESVVLSLTGGILGLLIANWTTGFLVASSTIDLPAYLDAGVDLKVALIMASLSIVSGIGFGLAPALTSSRVDLAMTLKEGAQSPTGSARRLLQNGLIVGEILLAFVLLAAAGHALLDFQRLKSTDLGFNSQDLMTLRLDLSGRRFSTRASRNQVATTLLEGLKSFPEAQAAAVAGPNLPIDDLAGSFYTIENQPTAIIVQSHTVSAGYFDLLDVPILEGRSFLSTDLAPPQGTPVIIVSNQLAKRFWPGESALGKRLRLGKPDEVTQAPWFSVVGVAGSIDQSGFGGKKDYPDIYVHVKQYARGSSLTLNLMVRAARPPDADMLTRLREEVTRLVPSVPAYDVLTLEQRLAEQVTNSRFLVLLMAVFTALAMLLAAVGIYGLLAYMVTQKKREFGIRLALGSRRRALFKLVLTQAVTLTAIGVVAGLILTVVMRVLLASRLPQLVGTDGRVLVSISVLLLGLALVASLVPAWRATRVNPNSVLREE